MEHLFLGSAFRKSQQLREPVTNDSCDWLNGQFHGSQRDIDSRRTGEIALCFSERPRVIAILAAIPSASFTEDNPFRLTSIAFSHPADPSHDRQAIIMLLRDLGAEAYGSGIGKILLAHMPKEARKLYLNSGPFVPLTANTIIHPDRLRMVLNKARTDDYALDVGEVSENLWCLAVPVRDRHNHVVAAMSVSRLAQADKKPLDRGLLAALQRYARDIQEPL
jgi:hypothetical protein